MEVLEEADLLVGWRAWDMEQAGGEGMRLMDKLVSVQKAASSGTDGSTATQR